MQLAMTQEFKALFPAETGRVNGYAVSKGLKVAHSLIENGTHIENWPASANDSALLPDQIEDFVFYSALKEHDRAQGIHNFARVIVQSGILEEGMSL
ncbi:hypothetical protein BH10PAT3_BH10PAT3_8200 [soil metagenome]